MRTLCRRNYWHKSLKVGKKELFNKKLESFFLKLYLYCTYKFSSLTLYFIGIDFLIYTSGNVIFHYWLNTEKELSIGEYSFNHRVIVVLLISEIFQNFEIILLLRYSFSEYIKNASIYTLLKPSNW